MDKEEFERRVLDLWVTTAIPLTRANLQYHTGEPAKRVKSMLEALTAEGTLAVATDATGDLIFSVPGAARAEDGPRSFAEKEKLDQLRAEVKADLEVKQARARTAEEEQRKLRAAETARKQALVVAAKEKAVAQRGSAKVRVADRKDDRALATRDQGDGGLLSRVSARDALELAGTARQQMERIGGRLPARRGSGELVPAEKQKSLLISGLASTVAGPLGWLYAGSLREAVPASLLYLLACLVLMKLPSMMIMPILFFGLPVSGLIGAIYAWQYNRHGKRQRLFDKDEGGKGA